ncbi:MAG: hypothetical protein E2O56_00050 [Gammaproteobacteria bacterium]|nr:MAG: hypothetical protein E2O56_00050 [Gammaproteobacteria bacterium]
MCPAVRLVTLLVVAGVAGTGRPLLVLYAAVITLFACSLQDAQVLRAVWRGLLRLRWLLLSIAIIYLWLTPGTPLVPAWGDASPTREGVQAGLLRAGALAVIALAASLMVNTTPREALAAGLIWLLQPFSFFGLPTRSFALRLSLTLEAVLTARGLPSRDSGVSPEGFIARAAVLGAERVVAVERNSSEQSGSIELPEVAAPPAAQWLFPALLAGGAALIVAL